MNNQIKKISPIQISASRLQASSNISPSILNIQRTFKKSSSSSTKESGLSSYLLEIKRILNSDENKEVVQKAIENT